MTYTRLPAYLQPDLLAENGLAGVVVKHYRRAIVVVALKVLSSGAAWSEVVAMAAVSREARLKKNEATAAQYHDASHRSFIASAWSSVGQDLIALVGGEGSRQAQVGRARTPRAGTQFTCFTGTQV